MRATRGLLASMGAGLSLILAGSLALSFVSALIAFNGWPGTETGRTADERAVIAELAPSRAAQRTPAALRLPAVPRRATPSPPPRRTAVARVSSRALSRPGAFGPARVATKAKPSRRPSHVPAPAATSPTKATTAVKPPKPGVLKATLAPAASTVKNLGSTLDLTVSRTGQALGGLVSPVLPAVGATVQQTTAAVGKLLSELTNALSQSVADVGTPAAGATPPVATAPAAPPDGAVPATTP